MIASATTESGKRVEAALEYLRPKIKTPPYIGIICGSGLGNLANLVQDPVAYRYEDIPHFPASGVPGHEGKLVFGTLGGAAVVVMKGRIHCYEGHSMKDVTLPVRVMCRLGIKVLLVTNAAGGLNSKYRVGDMMLLKDHLNMPGFAIQNPLVGEHDESFGARFVGMSRPYNRFLRGTAQAIFQELGLQPYSHEGVYAMNGGPTYETPAEARLLKIVGADAVGMSTVPEVIVAVQQKVLCVALSLITNRVITDNDDDSQPNHEEVIAAGKAREPDLEMFVTTLCKQLVACEASVNRELKREGRVDV